MVWKCIRQQPRKAQPRLKRFEHTISSAPNTRLRTANAALICSWTLLPQWLPGQQGVLSGRNMGPLGADFNIDLTDDNALQLPAAHAGLLALPEPPSSIKDKVSTLTLCMRGRAMYPPELRVCCVGRRR